MLALEVGVDKLCYKKNLYGLDWGMFGNSCVNKTPVASSTMLGTLTSDRPDLQPCGGHCWMCYCCSTIVHGCHHKAAAIWMTQAIVETETTGSKSYIVSSREHTLNREGVEDCTLERVNTWVAKFPLSGLTINRPHAFHADGHFGKWIHCPCYLVATAAALSTCSLLPMELGEPQGDHVNPGNHMLKALLGSNPGTHHSLEALICTYMSSSAFERNQWGSMGLIFLQALWQEYMMLVCHGKQQLRLYECPLQSTTTSQRRTCSGNVDQPVHWCLDTLHRHHIRYRDKPYGGTLSKDFNRLSSLFY